jgi:hypothetical protein
LELFALKKRKKKKEPIDSLSLIRTIKFLNINKWIVGLLIRGVNLADLVAAYIYTSSSAIVFLKKNLF